MSKKIYYTIGLIASLAGLFAITGASYRSGAKTARTMAAFEHVFEKQNLYLENRTDPILGVQYIDAVINYEIWRKSLKNDHADQKVVNLKAYSDSLSKHGDTYAKQFKGSTVYSVGEGMIFIGVKGANEGSVRSTIKSLRYNDKSIDYVPSLGVAGDEAILEFARGVERRLKPSS